MPDNSATITQLEAILNSGATSGTVDGQSVSFRSQSEIRARIRELQEADDSLRGRRPRVASIRVDTAW